MYSGKVGQWFLPTWYCYCIRLNSNAPVKALEHEVIVCSLCEFLSGSNEGWRRRLVDEPNQQTVFQHGAAGKRKHHYLFYSY